VNIPEFVGHVAAGRFREAYETLRERNVLAAICGYVCPAEMQCEHGCIQQHYTASVPIRHLQRWVARKAVEEGWTAEPRPRGPGSGKRVAVLGAGPAGISAAAALASLGYEVSLFNRGRALGGQAQETIPAERLPAEILHREIRDVLEGSGVKEHRTFAPIERVYNLDHVLQEGFDAVLIALGLSKSMPLPGSERPKSGVVGALEFLTRAKDGVPVLGAVLVLGGGNTAIDAALCAKANGASDVAIVYRRSFAEMPGRPAERDRAIQAGVHFLILTAPLAYVADAQGKLTGLKVVRTRLTVPGADGRRRPENIPRSEHVIPADMAIEALGQRIDEELAEALIGVQTTSDGLIWTREGTLETSRPGVFAAGDIVNGGATLVQAVAEGARAAREIDAFLRSSVVRHED
jgi:glutamate synthase (NADPH/NADH) small chain